MTDEREVYKCEVCGNLVEVLHSGKGRLICCGKPMVLMKPKTSEEGKEKHLPVIEKEEEAVRVVVGSVPHPMEENHYIEWIELIADGKVYRERLKPGDVPDAVFYLKAENVKARAYCNVHGLWES
ncbi:MAG TPA: desulfoferrodoxin [Candidatus Aenigmarchaeota archaeon]|nr:desulfoferrodoxin [Candidatus Aenigmarchaeota archaeon]